MCAGVRHYIFGQRALGFWGQSRHIGVEYPHARRALTAMPDNDLTGYRGRAPARLARVCA